MHAFTDDQGRRWQLSINVAVLKRCRRIFGTKEQDFDLMDPQLPQRLAMDPALFVDLLWELVDKSQHQGVEPEKFAEGLGGDAIERASEAFLEELFDFFPKGRRELQRATYRRIRQIQDEQIDKTVSAISKLSTEHMSSPESSASIPTS